MDLLSNILAVILGGGVGARLYPLTKFRSKPAVPMGGKYRLIDIPISNCINSSMYSIAVLTQFNSVSLHRHISRTYSFDTFHSGYVHIWAAEQTSNSSDWYQGTADAVRKQLSQIKSANTDYVLILAGDHLYRMDYAAMAEFHWKNKADITVAPSRQGFSASCACFFKLKAVTMPYHKAGARLAIVFFIGSALACNLSLRTGSTPAPGTTASRGGPEVTPTAGVVPTDTAAPDEANWPPTVDEVLAECPTAGEIAEVDSKIEMRFDSDPTAGQFVCTAAAGSADLTREQKNAYNAVLIMKHLAFDAPLPWTDQSLYDWFTGTISAIQYRSDIPFHSCCGTPPTILIKTELHAFHSDRWTAVGGLMALYIHEARHTFLAHRCQGRDNTIAEMGAFGVEASLHQWLTYHGDPDFLTALNPGPTNDYREASRFAFDSMRRNLFCAEPTPEGLPPALAAPPIGDAAIWTDVEIIWRDSRALQRFAQGDAPKLVRGHPLLHGPGLGEGGSRPGDDGDSRRAHGSPDCAAIAEISPEGSAAGMIGAVPGRRSPGEGEAKMLKAVVILEALFLLAAAGWTWRRARPVSPPYGRPLLSALIWILVQAAILAAGYYAYLSRLETTGPDLEPRIGGAAWPLYVIQVLRALALLLAAGAWLRVLKSVALDGRRKWLLVAAMGLSWFAPIPGSIFLFILLVRLKWVETLHGWGRVAALGGALAAFLALLVWPVTRVAGGMAQTTVYGLTDARSVPLLQGELPPGALAPAALARPFDFAFRFLTDMFRVQAVALILQLLSLPVHLRNVSLKRRFSIAFSLYRVIPGLLGGLVMLAGMYFGLGLYKSRVVNHAFFDTIRGAQTAAGLVLAAQTDGVIDEAPAAEVAASSRPWLTAEDVPAYFVLRRVEVPATPVVPPDSLAEVRLATLSAWSSPDTPDDLLRANLYGAGEVDTVGGLFQIGDRFYLAAALARKSPGEALVSEVYVPVDSLYLGVLAERAGVDIRLKSLPGVRISSSAVQVGGNGAIEAEFEGPALEDAAALPPSPSSPRSALTARPAGEPSTSWRVSSYPFWIGGTRRASCPGTPPCSRCPPHRSCWPAGSSVLPTCSPPTSSPSDSSCSSFSCSPSPNPRAVRTGRSIIDGILEDAKGLARAATRLGSGDLDYRIPDPGKDELGQLASAFNAMAADLKLRQEELIEKERLEADLTLARQIQERLLPQGSPSVAGLEVAGVSVPSLEVGGDLFYFLPLAGDRLGLAIGDVSGKSIPAALLMSNALAILRAETRLENEPADVLTQMNALIAEQVEPGRFLTFLYGVIDPHARTIRYACAGHNPPLIVRADGATEWLEQGGLALGILPDTTYTAADIALGPGDVLVLYSDGITEAARPMPGVTEATSPDEAEYFGEDRLLEAAQAHHTESARDILDGLVAAAHAFAGGAPQSDDLTVVVVKMRDEIA